MQLEMKDIFEVVDGLIDVEIVVEHVVIGFKVRLRCILVDRGKDVIIKILHVLHHR